MFFSSAIHASGRILLIQTDLSLSQGSLGSVLVPVEGCLDYIPIVSYRDPLGACWFVWRVKPRRLADANLSAERDADKRLSDGYKVARKP